MDYPRDIVYNIGRLEGRDHQQQTHTRQGQGCGMSVLKEWKTIRFLISTRRRAGLD